MNKRKYSYINQLLCRGWVMKSTKQSFIQSFIWKTKLLLWILFTPAPLPSLFARSNRQLSKYLKPPINHIYEIFSLSISSLTQPVSLSITPVSPVVAVLCCRHETDLIKRTSNLTLCNSATRHLPDPTADTRQIVRWWKRRENGQTDIQGREMIKLQTVFFYL